MNTKRSIELTLAPNQPEETDINDPKEFANEMAIRKAEFEEWEKKHPAWTHEWKKAHERYEAAHTQNWACRSYPSLFAEISLINRCFRSWLVYLYLYLKSTSFEDEMYF